MRLTATQLVTFWTCPFLWHVSDQRREPLPAWGSRRRFGTVIHAAIAVYERESRALGRALAYLGGASPGLPPEDLAEARSILAWRDSWRRGSPEQQTPACGEQALIAGDAPRESGASNPLVVSKH